MVETMYEGGTVDRGCFGQRVPGWALSGGAYRLRTERWEGSGYVNPFHPPGSLVILLVVPSVPIHADLGWSAAKALSDRNSDSELCDCSTWVGSWGSGFRLPYICPIPVLAGGTSLCQICWLSHQAKDQILNEKGNEICSKELESYWGGKTLRGQGSRDKKSTAMTQYSA